MIIQQICTISRVLAVSLLLLAWGYAANGVIIRGNHKVTEDTIRSYLPKNIKSSHASQQFPVLINRLYQTGFFDKVDLSYEGGKLVVAVHERPTISRLDVTGNRMVNSDKMQEILKREGLVRGNLLDRTVLETLKQSLKHTYYGQGYYNAQVEADLQDLPRNRVAVTLKIFEGERVRVRSIKIIGNHAFSGSDLQDEMAMTTPKIWSFLTSGDRYSRERFDTDAQTIQHYYQDRGYLLAKVISKQATLTPDRAWVHLVFNVEEDEIFHVSGYGFLGNLLGHEKTLHDFVSLKPASIYKRAQINDIVEKISNFYSDQGYALVNVQVVPKIDKKKHTVFLNFYVEPGQLTYIRQIHFVGNYSTNSDVLRREMRQLEGALFSRSHVEEGLRRLRNLVYIRNARLETVPVLGTTDQLDLKIHVDETPSAEFMVQIGYGTNGILYGARVHQENLWGTGKSANLQFNRDMFRKSYSANYTNPYFTNNGVSHSYGGYLSKTTPGRLNIANYDYDSVGLTTGFGIPLSDYDTLDLGLSLEKIDLTLGSEPSDQLSQFTQKHGTKYDHAVWSASWEHSRLNRQPFPTAGILSVLGAQFSSPVNKKQLSYYKLNYHGNWYIPLGREFILSLYGHVGYGGGLFKNRDSLPFLMNYYGGGIGTAGSVRGYEQNSLGPRDSRDESLGGNVITNGTIALIFPNGISENVRTSLFVDGGNVYDSKSPAGVNMSELRYSAGLNLALHVPHLGSLQISWAKALNKRAGDKLDALQFTFGTSFNS